MEESITQTTQTKFCPSCGETKPITEFSRNRTAKDGRQSECKACRNKRAKEKRDAHKLLIGGGDNPLIGYTPRQLMEELARRGYTGKLSYTKVIDITRL